MQLIRKLLQRVLKPQVKKGLSFTKAGVYAFCLVLFTGLIAVSTGLGGLYVFLSAGLGSFIVSGMLSEQVIKAARVKSVGASACDADQAFNLAFRMENRSRSLPLCGVKCDFYVSFPRYRFLLGKSGHICHALITQAIAKSECYAEATVPGLGRGVYQQLYCRIATTFPFGILEKFRVHVLKAELVVAPAPDQRLYQQLWLLLQSKLRGLKALDEFYSHKPYQQGDSLRFFDWKKNAGRPKASWVIKEQRAPEQLAGISVMLSWDTLASLQTAETYEALLCKARTVLDLLSDEQYELSFALSEDSAYQVRGKGAALRLLAGLPQVGAFTHIDLADWWQAQEKGKAGNQGQAGSRSEFRTPLATLQVLPQSVEWLGGKDAGYG